ncbi:MAG TPA: 2Fe-2S iron-sulfur cluster-binding protein [Pirellulales bacterium]|jgi:ferredoxin|nr:2Fe-2S iron-sulfur cluster-binding protein [Pirellulales bacterium]
MPIVTFVTDKKQVQVPEGANLRKEAIKAGVRIYNGMNGLGAGLNEVFNCHGLGTCGTCRVLIAKGHENASPMGMLEKANLKAGPAAFAYIGNEENMRLACQVEIRGDMEVVTRPTFNLFGDGSFFS